MAYIADLHIHSRFSRACSQSLNIPNLVEWAKYKGINLLGTGDFLHPLWLTELKGELKEDGSGFMYYSSSDIKFILTVEIASMYSHKGRVRRVHHLIFMPSFEVASKFQKSLLAHHANLSSDGRPTVGISSKDLLNLALDIDQKAVFIPAHAWTPWFGVFGSESGYDSLGDCFEDMVDKVLGIETGLSSDPAMNWRITELDNRSILSFSDAHSLPNLGREATVIDADLNQGFGGLWEAIKEQKIASTIEFYPEEGKYHYTGHRNCGVKYSPEDEKKNGLICPKCKRELTVGVMSRVEELANRQNQQLRIKSQGGIIESESLNRPGYKMLVPLLQIISEALNATPTSQKVLNEYKKLATELGGEVSVLTEASVGKIGKISGSRIAEGVNKARIGDILIDPGFDGVYGVVTIWPDNKSVEEMLRESSQLGLFD